MPSPDSPGVLPCTPLPDAQTLALIGGLGFARGMASEVALNLGVLLAVLVLGVSLMLLVVSGFSYARLRSPKLLLAGGAFLILAIKGGLAVWRGVALREVDLAGIALDAGVLGFLYASVAAR